LAGEKEGEELALHFLAAGNDGDADKERFIGVGHDAVFEDVDYGSATRALGVIGSRAVHGAGVVEAGFALF
jgi:hypothetical protein